MKQDSEARMAQAYEFILPIMFEKFLRPETLSYVIPSENGHFFEDGLFGPINKRLRSVGRALKMVDKRNELYRSIRFQEHRLGELASANIRSGEAVDNSRHKILELKAEIKELEFNAAEDIKHILRGSYYE